MRILSVSFGVAAIALLVTGCVAEAGDSGPDENVGVATQAQIDAYRSYSITQAGVVTASAWAGPITGGSTVEYWVAKSGYNATAARGINGASETCSSWKRGVCSAGGAGSTFYKATYVETPLNCAFPPGPCAPPAGAVSFLGSGSYRTAATGLSVTPYAWTYSTGTCEYWANIHPVSTGLSSQSPLAPAYTSLGQFESSVCALSPVPTTFYTSYYEPVANFCSIPTC